VEAFKQHGRDFVVADTLRELVNGMNRIGEAPLIDDAQLRALLEARDREIANHYSKDTTFIRQHRSYRGDKLFRVAPRTRCLTPRTARSSRRA
jgi:predicted oxidoreductase